MTQDRSIFTSVAEPTIYLPESLSSHSTACQHEQRFRDFRRNKEAIPETVRQLNINERHSSHNFLMLCPVICISIHMLGSLCAP